MIKKTIIITTLFILLVVVFMIAVVSAGTPLIIINSHNVSQLVNDAGFLTSYSETDPFWTGNSTDIARIGDCPSGQFIQNTTTGGVDCATPAGGGDITGVFTILDNYLYNGSASGDIYLRFNGTKLNETIDLRSSGITWGEATNGTLAKMADILGFSYYNSTDFDIADYSTLAEILAFNYYNSTDFSISDYFTKTNILGFSYYNSTNFDINDYLNLTTLLSFNYYNSSDFDITDYFTSAEILGFSYYNLTDFDIANYYNTTQTNSTIDEKIKIIYYNATSVDVVVGTLDSGDVESTWVFGGESLNVSETATTPGMDIRINFTGVSDFNQLIIRYKTSPERDHETNIELWNFVNSIWEDHDFYIESEHWDNPYIPIWDSSLHIGTGANAGEVWIRIYLEEKGKVAHIHYFDFVQLSFGAGTYSSIEADPLSWHKGASINASSYNITADYFFGNGSQLTDITLTESDPIFAAWDNFTGIPHATPSDGDVTHFSWADEIYDWVIGLTYTTTSYVDNLIAGVGNWSADKSDYFTKTNILDFSYYNSTDFSISDYSTTVTILGWDYYNITDFDISNYYTSTQTDTEIGNANTSLLDWVVAQSYTAGGITWANAINGTLYLSSNPFSFYNSTTIPSYILISEEGNLDVNSSTWWGNYDTASDLNNLITIDALNLSSGTIDWARIPTIYEANISDLQSYLTEETLWNANYSEFLTHISWSTAMNGTLAQTSIILGWEYYNSSDFSISNYFTKTNILDFSYYNSTDFDIADYSTTTQMNTAIGNANTSLYDWVVAQDYTAGGITWSEAINGTLAEMSDILGWNYYNSTDFSISDYFTKSDVLGFSYYNSTDFSISDYFTKSDILGFSYYNSTDFSIGDYSTTSTILGWDYYNSTTFDYTDYRLLTNYTFEGSIDLQDNDLLDVNDIGSTTDEIDDVYIGTNQKIYFGDGQESSIWFNGTHMIFD